jgi:mRNA-capping enzyme
MGEMNNRELCVIDDAQPLRPSKASIPDGPDKEFIKKKLADLSQTQFGRFPGANPVSIERQDLHTIKKDGFVVSLKSDGIRNLLLLTHDENESPIAILIDRSFKMFEIEIWASPSYFQEGSLFDGELIWDYSRDPCPRLAFLIFDIIVLEGKIQNIPYYDRLQAVHNLLVTNMNQTDEDIERIICEENKICSIHNHMDLFLYPKKFVTLDNLRELWSMRTSSPYRNDGLIFTKNSGSITKGTTKDSLKWKPDHTIDVLAELTDTTWKIWIGYVDQWVDMTREVKVNDNVLIVEFHHNDLLKCIAERYKCPLILECLCKLQDTTLHVFCVKERHDKSTPNSLFTVQKTILNVIENIAIEEILSSI